MPADRPRDVIEIAWPNNPWDTSLTWIDETARLLAVVHEWGRKDRDGDVRVATLEATLDNSDGRYTQQWAPNGTDLLVNGTFEEGLTRWGTAFGGVGHSGTVTVIDGDGWNDVRSVELADPDTNFTGPEIHQPVASEGFPPIPVTPGETLYVSVHARQVLAGTRGSLGIRIFWQDGTTTSMERLLTSQWVRYDVAVVVPAGKTGMRLRLGANRVNSSDTGTIRVSNVRLMREVPGPYPRRWPYVRTRRPIRWRRFYEGVWHQRFEGFITALPTAWDDFATGTCVIRAAGRMGLVADVDLPDTVWDVEVAALQPTHWWRLDEGGGSPIFIDSGSTRVHGTNIDPLPEDTQGAPMVGGAAKRLASGARVNGPTPLVGTADFTVAAIAYLDLTRPTASTPTAHRWTLLQVVGDTLVFGTSRPIYLELEAFTATFDDPGSPGTLQWSAGISAILGDPVMGPSQVELNVGLLPQLARPGWFLVVARRQSNTLTLRCEGMRASTAVTYSIPFASTLWLRRPPFTTTTTSPSEPVNLDDVLVWSRALSDGEIATLEGAFLQPWQGHTPFDRADAILNVAGVPSAYRDTAVAVEADHGLSFARTRLGGKALTYLRRVATAARGSLYDTPAGRIGLRQGADLLAAPFTTVQATFGQQPGDLPYATLGVDPSYDRIVNDVTASTVEGTPQRHVDQVSAEEHGNRSPRGGSPRDLLLGDETQTYSWASWRVNRDKAPSIGVDPLVLRPLGDSQVIAQVLQRGLDDLIRVRRTLPGNGMVVDQEARLAGGIERIARTRHGIAWTVEWRLEPTDPNPYGVADGTRVADGTTVAY